MKEKIIYQEKYKKPYPKLLDKTTTKIPETTVNRVDVISAGTIEVNNIKLLFRDLRVYYNMPNDPGEKNE